MKVLDKGFIELVDHMGSDKRIVQAARVSYGEGTKSFREDSGLIDYLWRNRHCYHPSMQVLTTRGWVKWEDCNPTEKFLVPDPKTRTYKIEELPLEVFDADEDLLTMKNSRMSFAVTQDHRMFFKSKWKSEFEIVRASKMPRWGNFDPIGGYSLHAEESPDPLYNFIGFYLGDGSYGSKNMVSFHLKKDRKKQYLTQLLTTLRFQYRTVPSSTYEDAIVYYVNVHDSFWGIVKQGERSATKCLVNQDAIIENATASQLFGLYQGLINSDGSIKADRPQVQYSSTSKKLLELFELLSVVFGNDAHHAGSTMNVTSYRGARTTLEFRGHHFKKIKYSGKVFCTTTSTGLLAVRGGDTDFGFICGNTSPFEQVSFTFHCKMPIFVARQWVRHRTAKLNEISGRYSVMKDEFYVPDFSRIQSQSINNKQGSSGEQMEGAEFWRDRFIAEQEKAYSEYLEKIDSGMAKELARINLPSSLYTEWYWTQDLHNLFHFLTLRDHSHAQWEIAQYAKAMLELIKPLVPLAVASWEKWTRGSITLSLDEYKYITTGITPENWTSKDQARLDEKVKEMNHV